MYPSVKSHLRTFVFLFVLGLLFILTACGGESTPSEDCAATAEVCDGVDNDCDGVIDNDVQTTYYADTDADGYGDASSSLDACSQPSGYVTNGSDCNDTNSDIKPGALDNTNDDVDNDCDGTVDEDYHVRQSTYYKDFDGDGHGEDLSEPVMAETAPEAPTAL